MIVSGVPVNFNGTLGAGDVVKVNMVNPRGKPTFARGVVIRNTGGNSMTVRFPNNDAAPTAEKTMTMTSGTERVVEAKMAYLTLQSTAGTTWEITATVAG